MPATCALYETYSWFVAQRVKEFIYVRSNCSRKWKIIDICLDSKIPIQSTLDSSFRKT